MDKTQTNPERKMPVKGLEARHMMEVVNQLIREFSEEKDDNTFYEAVRKNKNNQLESRKIYNVVFHVRELIANLCKTYALAEQIQSNDSLII